MTGMKCTKGLSPLVAAVLLVAFTMAIAGILMAWAATFSQQRLQTAAQCPAVTIVDVGFTAGLDNKSIETDGFEQNGTNSSITMRLLNQNSNIDQTGLSASVVFGSGENLENKPLDPNSLDPLDRDTFVIDAIGLLTAHSNTTVPVKVEIVTTQCPTMPVAAIIQ